MKKIFTRNNSTVWIVNVIILVTLIVLTVLITSNKTIETQYGDAYIYEDGTKCLILDGTTITFSVDIPELTADITERSLDFSKNIGSETMWLWVQRHSLYRELKESDISYNQEGDYICITETSVESKIVRILKEVPYNESRSVIIMAESKDNAIRKQKLKKYVNDVVKSIVVCLANSDDVAAYFDDMGWSVVE